MRLVRNIFLISGLFLGLWPTLARAAYEPFNFPVNLKVGIGTSSTSNAGLTVMTGNVGIGTWNPSGALDIKTGNNTLIESGNVGIGSMHPGQALDITGTVRATNFVGSGAGLTGIGSSLWNTANTNDVYEANGTVWGNVGIGTSFTSGAALTVMNGNVGIGTWVPRGQLDVEGTLSVATFGGNVGIGTWNPIGQFQVGSGSITTARLTVNSSGVYTGGLIQSTTSISAGTGFWTDTNGISLVGNENGGSGSSTRYFGGKNAASVAIIQSAYGFTGNGDYIDFEEGNVGVGTVDVMRMVNGNVGIGSIAPGQVLDVTGTVRATNFVGNGSGLTGVGGLWTTTNTNDVYETNGSTFGNVGIGTTITNAGAALSVMNGNVGIGTWVPGAALNVMNGNEGIGMASPNTKLEVEGGNIRISQSAAPFSYYIESLISGSIPNIAGIIETGNLTTYLDLQTQAQNVTSVTTNVTAIRFKPNSVERMRVDANGNVGIGSVSPAAELDVEGTISPTVFYGHGTDFNVGIGSASPGQALDVTGTVRATNFVGNGSGLINLPSSGLWNTTNTNDVYEENGSNFGNVGIGTTLTSSGAALTVMNGNVGIGTWVPGQALDVGSGNISANRYFAGASYLASNYLLVYGSMQATGNASFSGTTVSIGNVGIGTSIVSNAGLSVMNGNVGIGTWVPDSSLNIQGPGSSSNFITAGTGGTDYFGVKESSSEGWIFNPNSNNFGIGNNSSYGSAPFIAFNANGEITATVNSNGFIVSGGSVIGTLNGNVGIGTTAVGGTGEATLSVMNGNVGIGTWVPSSALSVSGQVSATSGGYNVPAFNIPGYGGVGSNSSDISLANTAFTDGITIPSHYITFFTNGPERVRIDSNGNIGIGTVNPVAKLSIAGNVGIGTNLNSIYLSTTPPSGGMIVQGNIGIGSLAPGQALDVAGTVRATQFLGDGSLLSNLPSSGNGWTLGASNVGISTTNNVGIGTNLTTTAGLTVMNGNVGIGTWVPGNLFQVGYGSNNVSISAGGINSSGTIIGGAFTGATIYGGGSSTSNLTLKSTGGTGTTDYIRLTVGNNGGTEAMRVIDSGNIGIGTVGPVAELDVEGTLYPTVFYGHGTDFNVGIGSASPGQALDVTGTVRDIGEIVGTGGITLGGVNNTSWPAGGASNWTYTSAGNIGLSTTAAVGIGTTFVGSTGEAALSIMNGNVGIGTWVPGSLLQIGNSTSVGSAAIPALAIGTGNTGLYSPSGALAFTQGGTLQAYFSSTGFILPGRGISVGAQTDAYKILGVSGNAAIGSGYSTNQNATPTNALIVQGNIGIGTFNPFAGGLIVLPANTGNVGIGTVIPGQALDVNGTIRLSTGSGGTIIFADGTSQSTAATGGGASNWTYSSSGNIGLSTTAAVGIGTSFVGGTGEAALSIMNGNVGIGTWVPGATLVLEGSGNLLQFQNNSGAQLGYVTSNGMFINSLVSPYSSASNVAYGIGDSTRGMYSTGANIINFSAGVDIMEMHQSLGAMVGSGETLGFTSSTDPGPNAADTAFSRVSAGNIGIGTSGFGTGQTNGGLMVGNIGIGTTLVGGTGEAALSVMNGNVGIGTWVPSNLLTIGAQPSQGQFNVTVQGQSENLLGGKIDITSDPANSYIGMVGSVKLIWALAGSNGFYNGTVDTGLARNAAGIVEVDNGALGSLAKLAASNIGIGTFDSTGGGLIVKTGNVGIGSLTPGQALDVQGTVRDIGEIVGAGGITLGGVTDTSWPAGGSSNWTYASVGNIGLSTTAAVGIGTSFVGGTGEAALSVMNGNVGIGTWVPKGVLDIEGGGILNIGQYDTAQSISLGGASIATQFIGSGQHLALGDIGQNPDITINASHTGIDFGLSYLPTAASFEVVGNIGIGTIANGDNFLTTAPPNGGMLVEGNVGIGTWVPADLLNVMGNVSIGTKTASNYLTVGSGGSEFAVGSGGNIYSPTIFVNNGSTAGIEFSDGLQGSRFANITSDSSSDLIFDTTSSWTERMRIDVNGNVGIGTTTPIGGLTVMNGNVGIGTWVPGAELQVNNNANAFVVTSGGNVGIGTTVPGGALVVMNGSVGIGTTIPGSSISAYLDIENNLGVNKSTITVRGFGNSLGYGLAMRPANDSGNPVYINFYNSSGTQDGSIGENGSTQVQYITTSDRRLKENIVPSKLGLELLRQIPVNDFNFISDKKKTLQGFIAQELYKYYPEAVTVGDRDVKKRPWGVDYGRLTPLLAQSVKDLDAVTVKKDHFGNVGIGTWVPKGALQVNNTITYFSEYSNGNSGTSFTINWNNGNNQKITLTGNCIFTFTAPGGPTHLTFDLIQDGTGSRTVTWPAGVLWPGKVAPVLTTTASGIDVVSCYYNGTNYYCSAALNFG